ncbi:MAG: type I methionyl aminopeptidase [Bacteroidetes bacterium]|nr:type I methionyl aminopeptidase [Bacteroidota bacterium]
MSLPKPLTSEQIENMKAAGKLCGQTLSMLKQYIKPGITTMEINNIAEEFIRSHNAIPTFKGLYDFPCALCISVEDCVIHGIPNDKPLIEGQIVSVDCGVTLNGWIGDSAYTYPVGEISDAKKQLMKIAEESLYLGIKEAKKGNKTYDISKAIQTYCEAAGYSLTREFTGHGVGRKLHQEPPVPNFVPPLIKRRNLPNAKLFNGLAIAIEPMIHLGGKDIYIDDNDKWSVITKDNTPTAHYEHTIIINDDEPIITTLV